MLYVLCVGNFSVIFDSEAILRDVDALENVMTSKVPRQALEIDRSSERFGA